MALVVRNCDYCSKQYEADTRNLARGWGLCCSKSCAARKREMSKPGYSTATVAKNNERRANWVQYSRYDDDGYLRIHDDYDPGDSEYWDGKDW